MSGSPVSKDFSKASNHFTRPRKPDRRKRIPPVSIRFNDEERRLLTSHAGEKALSTYVREYVIKAHGGKQRKQKRTPKIDTKIAAQLLSGLGRSELPALLRDILCAVDKGVLPTDEETRAQLLQASAEIIMMRQMLIKALGLRNEVPQ